MTNSKKTRKALLSSVLALLLCVTMLLGTTFAWFTDTASTSVNKIQAGTLDVALEMKEGNNWVSAEGKTLDFVKAEGHGNEAILWEPGCTYKLPELRVVNKGNLALKYKVVITGIDGDAKLNEVIDWTIGEVAQGTEQKLAAGENAEFTISGTMQENAGNGYQGLTIEGISITVYATQDTVEYDSSTNVYDRDATLPTIMENQNDLNSALNTQSDVNVFLPNGTYTLPVVTNKNVTIYGTEDTVIDMTTSGIIGVQNTNLDITFDGVTVKFANEDYKGITHSSKVTYRNCTLIGKQFLYAEDVEFVNCTFINNDDYSVWTYGAGNVTFESCTFVSGGKAILIYIEDGDRVSSADHKQNVTVNNCVFYDNGTLNTVKAAVEIGDAAYGNANLNVNLTATNNTIYGFANNDEGTPTGNKMWGNKNSIPDDRLNVTADNNTEYDGHWSTVSNASELATALDNSGNAPSSARNIVLIADIDGSNWTAIPSGSNYPAVSIDGNGHTIKNLAQPLFSALPARHFVFKNINFTNVNISSANNRGLGVIVGEGQANGGGSYTITNCHIKGGTIDGGTSYYVGGFIGFKSNGCNVTFDNCSVTDLTLKTSEESVGAFAGHLYDTVSLTNCSVKGSTSITNSVDREGKDAKAGAFVGTVYTVNATGCSVDNTVTVSNKNAKDAINNGFFGRNAGGTITVN